MKTNALVLTYFSIIALTMVQSMVSFACENPIIIERAIVQTSVSNNRYKKEYTTYKKERHSFQLINKGNLLEDFDAKKMPIYLADYEDPIASITPKVIKENHLIPSSIHSEANQLLKKIALNTYPEAIYFKTIDEWYLVMLFKTK